MAIRKRRNGRRRWRAELVACVRAVVDLGESALVVCVAPDAWLRRHQDIASVVSTLHAIILCARVLG